jgi:transcriptional regulator with XRE-family HTH domain
MIEMMKPSEVFAARLRDTREARRLSQTELARRATDQGRELDRAAVLRIESGKRGLALDEAVALAWILQAVPAQMLTAPESSVVGLTDNVGVDGEGIRNWLVYGDPLLAMPAVVDTDEARAVVRAHFERDVTRHALALADAVRGEDKAGVTAAGEAILSAARAYLDALEGRPHLDRAALVRVDREEADDAR